MKILDVENLLVRLAQQVETVTLNVVKRSGCAEPFRRDKVISGVRKACKGRPVGADWLNVVGPLRDLDEVAYLRFA